MNQAAFDPGRVAAKLRLLPGQRLELTVAATRPLLAAALRGRPADRAAAMLPMLYAICGKAQGVAARLALAAARGTATAPRIEVEVLAEARREHLWRLLLDWPRRLGLPTAERLLAEGVAQATHTEFLAWAGRHMAEPLAQLLEVLTTLPAPPPLPAATLPPLDASASLAAWPRLDAAFAAQPHYGGVAVETGAWARCMPEAADLVARVRARGDELTTPGLLGQASAVPVAPGVGRACVETARGLLMHEVSLDGERVADYVIVAPTEWNFHPQGGLVRAFAGMAATDAATWRGMLERAVLALDPCVPHDVSVEAAA